MHEVMEMKMSERDADSQEKVNAAPGAARSRLSGKRPRAPYAHVHTSARITTLT